MKIVILLNDPFPYGMACTNRTQLYSKGLVELGNNVEILIPHPTEALENIKNFHIRGISEGVKFRYAYESVKRKSFIGRRFQNFVSVLNSFLFLLHSKPDVTLIVTNTFKYTLLVKICSLFTHTKIVREKTEVPFYNQEILSKITRFRIRNEFKLYDGIIVISSQLKRFFLNDFSLKTKIIEVPILIDSSNDILLNDKIKKIEPNLVYTGSLSDRKDGVVAIIKAFAEILKKYPNIKLILTGDINQSDVKEEILFLIDTLNLRKNLELVGYLSKEKLNELTSTSLALLLAKPKNRQNKYNMATKVGEYLLTGRPVVVSSVDPVTSYLTHRQNAFIVKPEEKQIVEQLEFILNSPDEANAIGLAGKKSATSLFDYKKHALRINDFFKDL